MKQLIFTIAAILISSIIFAQAPESFNYQGVIRDLSGNPKPNSNVNLKLIILEGSSSGNTVFSETHNIVTTEHGLVNLEIGQGVNIQGSIIDINWSENVFYLRLEADSNGGSNFEFLGASKLLSVPYALYAKRTNLVEGAGIQIDDNIIQNTGDLDVTNEIQNLSINGNQLSISEGNTIDLSSINTSITAGTGIAITGEIITNTGDLSSINELQTLTTSNDTITISNGNSIKIPPTCKWESFSEGYIQIKPGDFTGLEFYDPYEGTGCGWGSDNEKSIIAEVCNRFVVRAARNATIQLITLGENNNRNIVEIDNLGNIKLLNDDAGIILTSPNGKCWKKSVDNFGNWITTEVACN